MVKKKNLNVVPVDVVVGLHKYINEWETLLLPLFLSKEIGLRSLMRLSRFLQIL